MFLTARLGSGLVIGRLPDSDDDKGAEKEGRGGSGSGSDTPSQQRRRRARQRGLPWWSAPSAITCSGVGYGFQMGAEVRGRVVGWLNVDVDLLTARRI